MPSNVPTPERLAEIQRKHDGCKYPSSRCTNHDVHDLLAALSVAQADYALLSDDYKRALDSEVAERTRADAAEGLTDRLMASKIAAVLELDTINGDLAEVLTAERAARQRAEQERDEARELLRGLICEPPNPYCTNEACAGARALLATTKGGDTNAGTTDIRADAGAAHPREHAAVSTCVCVGHAHANYWIDALGRKITTAPHVCAVANCPCTTPPVVQ